MILLLISVVVFFGTNNANPIAEEADLNITLKNTRRIVGGHEVGETRPYMVYLRPAMNGYHKMDTNWLCGGVIIHEHYILTSAACVEDAKQFYVVSGTHRWVEPSVTNDCIKYGAKKAVWKCVPKSYVFDGYDFDNIQWMAKDIAVVKVEDDFNFMKRVRGCDFIPKKIDFNNITEELEKPGTIGSIAGWGATDSFSDFLTLSKVRARNTANSPVLLEANVVVLSKKSCKSRWDPHYHHIIDSNMICAKEISGALSDICSEQEVNCKDLVYSDEKEDQESIRRVMDPRDLQVHSSVHHIDPSRRTKIVTGGFCENDHGGPLVVGQGKSAIVVGLITACRTKPLDLRCRGPFLYTSVWKHRHLISCAIDKELGATCRRLLRSTNTPMIETVLSWPRADGVVPDSQPTPTNETNSQNVTSKKPSTRN